MDESEWRTRKERIDTRLRQCDPPWQILPWRTGLDLSTLHRHAVTEFPTSNGPADYALFISGRLLGILEAKRVAADAVTELEAVIDNLKEIVELIEKEAGVGK